MADFDEPRPEVQRFLSDRAQAVDRDAAPIEPEEAADRLVTHSLEPGRRWIHTPAAVADRARRRPAVAAAVIAALLVGSVGGFAAGRSSAPGKANVAARGAARDSSTPSTVVSRALATGGGFGMAGDGSYEIPQMTRLFLRTTADGVALRAYLQDMGMMYEGDQPLCDPNSWCPPPECSPTEFFLAELSNAEAVTQSGASPFPLEGHAASRGEAPLGQMEGAPARAYMVQTDDQVTNVRATWPDGFVDEMAPVEGWAIVAHSGETGANTIEVVLSDGSTEPLKDFQNGMGGSYPTQCNPPPPPPPELPPAGEEQPADVAAASQGVTEAYQYVFTNDNDPNNNAMYQEDAESIKAAGEQVKQNFPEATETITVEVGEIRFLSATEAALYFELKYTGGALFGRQVGYAKLIDGRWKIARDTMCMVLGWGGGMCDPPPDPARSGNGGYGGGAPAQPTETTTAN